MATGDNDECRGDVVYESARGVGGLEGVDDLQSFGHALKVLRDRAGLTIRDVETATRLGPMPLSRSKISKVETGAVLPDPRWLGAFVNSCGVKTGTRAYRQWISVRARLRRSSPPVPTTTRSVELWDPFALDIHRAISIELPSGVELPALPAYLRRSHDDEVDDLVKPPRRSMLIVFTGGSSTGKTRAMYEAARNDHLRGAELIYPRTADELLALLRVDGIPPGAVLWLNELQNYLVSREGEEVGAGLRRLLDGTRPDAVLVLSSMWSQYWAELTSEHNGRLQTRQLLLHSAQRIRVPDAIPASQLAALAADVGTDPRLEVAARRAGRDGRVIQVLAGGPVLVDRLEHPECPSAHYGAAVVRAAADARRLGHHAPVRREMLAEAAVGYLDDAYRIDAPDDWFAVGLSDATRAVHGVKALTSQRDSPGVGPSEAYVLHDYIDEHLRLATEGLRAPASLWRALVTGTGDAHDRIRIAEQARKRLLHRTAVDLLVPAIQARDTSAMWEYVRMLNDNGRTRSVGRVLRLAASHGDVGALNQLAGKYVDAGRDIEAERMLRKAADAGHARSAVDLATLLGRTGREPEAAKYIDAALSSSDRSAGWFVAEYLESVGRAEEASDFRERDLFGQSDGLVRARELLQSGETAAAETLLRRGLAEGSWSDGWELADLLLNDGRTAEAVDALLDLARNGDIINAWNVCEIVEEVYGIEALHVIWRTLVQMPDDEVFEYVGSVLAENRRTADAIQLYTYAVEAGKDGALTSLALMLEVAGRHEEAIEIRRKAAEQGGLHEAVYLAELLEQTGRVGEAEGILRHAADRCFPDAMRSLGSLLVRRGRRDEAEYWLRACIQSGGDMFGGSVEDLARLLSKTERGEEARRLRRYGLEPDGGTATVDWYVAV